MAEPFVIHPEGGDISAFPQILDYARPLPAWVFHRIPGALYVPKKMVWAPVEGVAGMLPPWPVLRQSFQRLGLDPAKPTLVYDQGNSLYAARLAWALLNTGFINVALLDGGLDGWRGGVKSRGSEVRGSEGRGGVPSWPVEEPPRTWYATLDDVAGRSDGTVLLDTRSRGEFVGSDLRSARGGRIPGALHWEWKRALSSDGRTFKSAHELLKEFQALGIDAGTPVITYCQSGVRASHTAYALWRAGIRNVRVYDGSWEEWGNRQDTPAETGEPR